MYGTLMAIIAFLVCVSCRESKSSINTVKNDLQSLHIVLSDSAMNKIVMKKDAALALGVLKKESSDWVPATLSNDSNSFSSVLRLKGDWTDHLKSHKWSFRVKTDKKMVWNGMRTFSLQHPQTRYYLAEWFYHKWLSSEDILATTYGFINLKLNDKDLGIYAYEEHFEKQLIASNQRREGIIVKFNEDGIWDARIQKKQTGIKTEKYYESHLTSEVEPFDKKDVFNSETLAEQFDVASTLMHQLRNGLVPHNEILDLDKTAKFLAICDINKAYHGLIWHNLRFYYNPINSKLEPVGFDAFMETGALNWINKPFFGHGLNESNTDAGTRMNFWQPLFKDESFTSKYVSYLLEFTDPLYLDSLFATHDDYLNTTESIMKTEFESYAFDRSAIIERAQEIRMLLVPHSDAEPVVYRSSLDNKMYNYRMYNYHGMPILPYAIGDRKDRILLYLKDAKSIPAFHNATPAYFEDFVTNIEADWLFYKMPGLDSVFCKKMYEYDPPAPLTPLQELASNAVEEMKKVSFLKIDKTNIYIKSGQHTLIKTLYIPEGYRVFIAPNTSINLTQGSAFVSSSPIEAIGGADDLIQFTSSDKENNGFVLLGNKQKSTLSHVLFSNMQATNIGDWELTGAVTIHESMVELIHCSFIDNNSEDALNLIQSNVLVDGCSFYRTFADALDADFCSGDIKNSQFIDVKNDCIDVSGSKVNISYCTITNCMDKAISIGEQSTASIWDVEITNAATGIAAKDLSKVTFTKITMNDCLFGFSAYQKKPEFGGASIIGNTYSLNDVDELSASDEQSTITLE